MGKKRKRSQSKRRMALKDFKPSKGMIMIFSIVFAVMIIIRGTFAWETYTSSKENKLGNIHFDVVLREKFTPNNEWYPGSETLKKVYVMNEGNYKAFVRISVEEYLLLFDIDIEGMNQAEGTANVKFVKDSKGKETIKQDSLSTWKKDAVYPVKVNNEAGFYQSKLTVPDIISKDSPGLNYPRDEAKRKTTDLNYFKINFGDVKDYNNSLTKNYWKYGNDGYFYYSEILNPGEKTTLFMKSISLFPTAPNRMKNGLYKANISMDGSYSTRETLGKWNHETENDEIYKMLKSKITSQPE
ncbi:BsaA family SipW-dependent biofilm matrix protein [Vagococcus silagei]|uniref:Alternate signal-mediated exported protein n=1 Tax=Vagococcus silagei TaxID=2508885 RepID=A0A4S3B5H1_9ENTE|nr:BsaA family SipW-dependent biofilm matrix protein [Vagococcus silagei]THB60696.1 hypothetical protein ESZ54_08880 [Vagococcus silagei]